MAAKRRVRGRTEGGRSAKPTLLIVCEGETEYNYFKELKSRFRASWMIPLKSDKPDPNGVMECAAREAKKHCAKGLDVEAWILIDAESEVEEKRRPFVVGFKRLPRRRFARRTPALVSSTGFCCILRLVQRFTLPKRRCLSLEGKIAFLNTESQFFLVINCGNYIGLVGLLRPPWQGVRSFLPMAKPRYSVVP